jgi:hypothetical protein
MPKPEPLREKPGRAEREAERRELVEAYKRIALAKTFAEKLEERRKISIKKK